MLHPDQARIRTFDVVADLPEPLKPLLDIAYNLWWSWHSEAVELFLRLDRDLWVQTHHNPVALLGRCSQETLEAHARDEGYISSVRRVSEALKAHLTRREKHDYTIAYFCTEFGLTECLQIYSGGLGCLAGDHLKSASELGLPLVGVGLLYRNGYFQQYLNADGWQQEYYPELDFSNLPVKPVLGDDGRQVRVSVDMPGRVVQIGLWIVQVGIVRLFLLDTNLPENQEADRLITSQLYGGDMEMRIRQEIVLGIGGVRALAAIGIEPDVCHMNEGHSAFLALERIRRLIDKHDISFDQARQAAASSHVFTTHTPVPAGIDRFPPDMMQRYFTPYHEGLRLDLEGLLALGRENVFRREEYFSMAILAIRTAERYNGVSRLHGEVSRNMWQQIWPAVPENEIPIGHVTNGVHARSWMSGDLIYLLDRYLGDRWQFDPVHQAVWSAVTEIPDEELWRVHERRKHRMIVWIRRKLKAQLEMKGADADEIHDALEALSPDALTVGFARRFATYKRGNLLLRDEARLMALLNDEQRPVQFVVAGKAHPADGPGKDLLRNLSKFCRRAGVRHRFVIIENYDIHVARYLVQGCDVWLNTPRRGMEASGTSGMKAALNGVLNCSVLDGWWDEAYESDIGWAIGRGEVYSNVEVQDNIESRNLYDLLEKRIAPLYYARDNHDMPRQWIQRMKQCLIRLAPMFNTNRMVREYRDKLYLPALERTRMLRADDLARSREFAAIRDELRAHWGDVRIDNVTTTAGSSVGVRKEVTVTAVASLAGIDPREFKMQIYYGMLDNDNSIRRGTAVDMRFDKALESGQHQFVGSFRPQSSGLHGLSIRILPGGELFEGLMEPGLIRWDSPSGAGARAPQMAGRA